MSTFRSPLLFFVTVCGSVCWSLAATPAELAPEPGEEWSGGTATVFDATQDAFGQAAPNLSEEQRNSFFVGKSFFNENWVVAPSSVPGRDGLGPLFNARSCSACHFKDGRSAPPERGQPMTTMLLRISILGTGPHGGPKPDPIYGGQIQGRGMPGVPAEADVLIEYEEIPGAFGDGEGFSLRKPRHILKNIGYGQPSPALRTSGRVAPITAGMGLLEAVPEETLKALEDPEDRNHDGISGRINRVWDLQKGRIALGRFGWKAEQPGVLQQTAGAFHGDMGITSSLFPRENHTDGQAACATKPSGGSPEVNDEILHAVALYAQTLAVPARRHWKEAKVLHGKQLFIQAGCAACHIPMLRTGDHPEFPQLSRQTIRPYTDLLLHDMGEGLADGRPTFAANGREWRTAPLWGVGLIPKVNGHAFLLHDGRARGLAEAVLWHGGEAERSQEKFRLMLKTDREAMIAFLESL